MVLSMKRNLPLTAAAAWARGMGLTETESAYFQLLVRADSAATATMRRDGRLQAAALRQAHLARHPTLAQAEVLCRWYVPVILELAKSAGSDLSAEWLHARVWPEVDSDELQATLDTLRAAGIVSVQQGEVEVDPTPFSTDKELTAEMSHFGRRYHEAQLAHAATALQTMGQSDRYLGSLAVAVREQDLQQLSEALHRFQLSAIEPFRSREGADTVVQVSVQMFRRTTPPVDD
jgi:uncharacterized protein (TIGR02147 family)